MIEMAYATHKKPELEWKRKREMLRKTKFTWLGRPVECEKVVNGEIVDQDILQDVITDPVKGHLWDLKTGKCLAHDYCKCVLMADVDASFFLFGNAKKVRDCMKKIEKLLDEFWKEP